MSLVTIKNGDFYYTIPLHELTRYWLPVLNDQLIFLELPNIPKEIPEISRLCGLKRGKGIKRVVKAYEQKGSGKHVQHTH